MSADLINLDDVLSRVPVVFTDAPREESSRLELVMKLAHLIPEA